MLKNNDKMRIKRLMVAVISLMLILVTTISYIALPPVFAEGEDQAQQTAPAGQDSESGQSDEAAQNGDGGADAAAQKTEPVKLTTISASSYIVMSGSTSEKVLEKHAERKMQPGSITMLMTAMVVLDNMYDEKELKNTVETGSTIAEFGGTFKEGESASVGDLLEAMLIGGDVQAAELLAKYSASSRKVFVNEMNSRCLSLGLMDTQFTNASGMYDIRQYSTAADLAVITQAAFRYQKIKEILAKPQTKITVSSAKGKKEREIEITGTDPLLAGSEDQAYKYIQGGMLGTCGEGKNNTQFAAAATKDDMQLIVVLMDSRADKAAVEARSLFEYGDSKVTKNTIVKKGKREGRARVRNGERTRVPAYTATKGFAFVPPEGSDSLIQTQVVMMSDLEAPLKKGDKVGEFRIYVADELKGTVDLVIKEDVPVGWYPSRYYISNRAAVMLGILMVLLIAFFARVIHVRRRRLKRREARRRARILEIARRQLEIDEDRRRREWQASGYDDMPPRTTDLRRDTAGRKPGGAPKGTRQ